MCFHSNTVLNAPIKADKPCPTLAWTSFVYFDSSLKHTHALTLSNTWVWYVVTVSTVVWITHTLTFQQHLWPVVTVLTAAWNIHAESHQLDTRLDFTAVLWQQSETHMYACTYTHTHTLQKHLWHDVTILTAVWNTHVRMHLHTHTHTSKTLVAWRNTSDSSLKHTCTHALTHTHTLQKHLWHDVTLLTAVWNTHVRMHLHTHTHTSKTLVAWRNTSDSSLKHTCTHALTHTHTLQKHLWHDVTLLTAVWNTHVRMHLHTHTHTSKTLVAWRNTSDSSLKHMYACTYTHTHTSKTLVAWCNSSDGSLKHTCTHALTHTHTLQKHLWHDVTILTSVWNTHVHMRLHTHTHVKNTCGMM